MKDIQSHEIDHVTEVKLFAIIISARFSLNTKEVRNLQAVQ